MLLLCHECDLLNRLDSAPGRQQIKCARCGHLLHQHKPRSVERTLALALSGCFLFIIANSFPLLIHKVQGDTIVVSLVGSAWVLYQQQETLLALLVFFTVVLVPMIRLTLLLYLSWSLHFQRPGRYLMQALKFEHVLRPWSMMEIFLFGVLVSMVKLMGMAMVIPGIALWGFAALIVIMVLLKSAFDAEDFWRRVTWQHPSH